MERNRIDECFSALSKKGEKALVCYLVVGYPNLDATIKAVDALVGGGADIIELGIPFSDPIADGPIIQQASHTALEKGVTPNKALATARKIRKRHPKLPLIIMTYSNILIRVGIDKFLNKAKDAGMDGFILPDMPIEEAGDYLRLAREKNIATVFLTSPNTSEQRLKQILEKSTGFVYLVSVYGITGTRKNFEDYTIEAIRRAKRASVGKIPVGVGFGISNSKHVRSIAKAGADAVIVGSAIVTRMSDPKTKEFSNLKSFAKSLKWTLKSKV